MKLSGRDGNKYHCFEGAYMAKLNGKYYLQYAAPATELLGYGNGVYVGEHSMGPFTYQTHNPFSLKTGGFARGAGHGSIKMYSIEPEELVGKRNAPVIFNTHGGGFFFPLGADEIKNMRMQHGPKMRTNTHGDFICRQKIQNWQNTQCQ